MARIPAEVIERLKSEVSVEDLARARGVELKRHGKDLVGLCPFHEDHEPSLVITPERNLWHCLGACRAGGSPIDWVMRAERVSFRHAVEILRAGMPGEGGGNGGDDSQATKVPSPLEPSADDEALLREVIL